MVNFVLQSLIQHPNKISMYSKGSVALNNATLTHKIHNVLPRRTLKLLAV